MCTRLISEKPSGDWSGIERGLSFKLHPLICKKQSMSVLLVYLSEQKNVYTLYGRTLQGLRCFSLC